MADYISKYTGNEIDTILDNKSNKGQINWSQNDNNNIDYVKNRTHYIIKNYNDFSITYHKDWRYAVSFNQYGERTDELVITNDTKEIFVTEQKTNGYNSLTADGSMPCVSTFTATYVSDYNYIQDNEIPNLSTNITYRILIDGNEIFVGQPRESSLQFYSSADSMSIAHDYMVLGSVEDKICIATHLSKSTSQAHGVYSHKIYTTDNYWKIYLSTDLTASEHNITLQQVMNDTIVQIPTKYIDYSSTAPSLNSVNSTNILNDNTEFLIDTQGQYKRITNNILDNYILSYYNNNLDTQNKNLQQAINEIFNKFSNCTSSDKLSSIQQIISNYDQIIINLQSEIKQLKQRISNLTS